MMTLDEDLRKQELATQEMAEKEERKQTIQYALIAIGIVSLAMIFLLLSRSMIINAKTITFLSVLALLMVFEFINLLIHPFLERVTHHSPILMLLALVALAAILVPLHHKIEHWATKKLLAKNKAVRIAAAKKILEEYEGS